MTTKTEMRMAAVVGAFLALGAWQGSAQSVQTLSVNLTAYDHTGAKQIKITNKELISYFAGTNVPGARLLLITPSPNEPGTLGNLNAYLQVVKNNTVIVEVPSPDAFNVYQDYAANKSSGTRTATRAIDRFSVEFGGFLAELQGFSIWNISGGSGAFVANVNGAIYIDGVTDDWIPAHGTITASAPKAGQ
jgi:hypothetical protein